MRRLIIAALFGTLLVGGTYGTAEAAPAVHAKKHVRNKPCITRPEFRRIHKNQTLSRVRQIVGGRGKVSSDSTYSDGDRSLSLSFNQCGGYGTAYVYLESTETQTWDADAYGCYDWDGDGYEEDCEGDYVTTYSDPLIVTSKGAYWS